MDVYIHDFGASEKGLVYKGLNKIEKVKEVVIYNEKGKLINSFVKDCEAVAIFSRTLIVIKTDKKYDWLNVFFDVKDAETVDGLKNGCNYVKIKGKWYKIDKNIYTEYLNMDN